MRNIEKKMIAFLDEKLASNGLAQQCIVDKNARQLFIEAAKVCVGIREKTGNNDGPMVELIQETIGGHSHEAWCMAFVQTCIAYAEVKTGVKSHLEDSEHCLTVWNATPKDKRVKTLPLPGAIIVWRHGKTTSGHTGIVLGADKSIFNAVEGNTTSGTTATGKVVREGGGVYFTERSMKGNGDMKIMGFIIPF